jgi:hypothetical protein
MERKYNQRFKSGYISDVEFVNHYVKTIKGNLNNRIKNKKQLKVEKNASKLIKKEKIEDNI